MVRITCPQCGKALTSSQDLDGKKVRCPGCGETFSVAVQEESFPPFAPSRNTQEKDDDEEELEQLKKSIGWRLTRIGAGFFHLGKALFPFFAGLACLALSLLTFASGNIVMAVFFGIGFLVVAGVLGRR